MTQEGKKECLPKDQWMAHIHGLHETQELQLPLVPWKGEKAPHSISLGL